jgi:2-C-methyl-D-erythritol 4-phosphate cytidylyltransferase
VIFGGNSGIGAAIRDRAVELGASVCSYSRGTTETDIGSATSVESALTDAASRMGKIDYIVNCAALLMRQPLVSMRYDDVVAMVNSNLLGPLNIARESHRYLAESRGGLLFFSSSSYTRGRAYYSVYSASKAAIVNLTQGLADEWAADGIRINCISPERTATPMRTATFGLEPSASLLTPERVADVSLSTMLSTHSGQVIDVRIDALTFN